MPQHEPKRLGSVAYYGYSSLSEAFHALDEQAQAVYMSIMATRSPGTDPAVMLNIDAYAKAFGMTPMNMYSLIGTITSMVVIGEVSTETVYTNLASSVQEFFDPNNDHKPVAVILIVPLLPEHDALLGQFEDLAREIPE